AIVDPLLIGPFATEPLLSGERHRRLDRGDHLRLNRFGLPVLSGGRHGKPDPERRSEETAAKDLHGCSFTSCSCGGLNRIIRRMATRKLGASAVWLHARSAGLYERVDWWHASEIQV